MRRRRATTIPIVDIEDIRKTKTKTLISILGGEQERKRSEVEKHCDATCSSKRYKIKFTFYDNLFFREQTSLARVCFMTARRCVY